MACERITTGNTIVLEHLPGVYSLYFHLDQIFVEEGDWVEQKQEIGLVGNTGLSTAAHLHWEIRVNGVAVNPDSFLEERVIDFDVLSVVVLSEHQTKENGGDSP
jgi:murein DD-endopeptidase MepM/ murein hydrolase activator NlpD